MFAYCDNSPVANLDSHGNMKQRIKEFYAAGVGGGGAAAGLGAGLFALIRQIAKDTSDLIAQTKAQAAAKRRESQSKDYTVYFLKDKNDLSNNIVYVGRVKTTNMEARMIYHSTKGREYVYSISNLTYTNCRLLEQAGMAYHHSINRGNHLYNQIRGISIKNGLTFLEAVKVFVSSANYVDNTYLPFDYIANQYENWLLNG